jgi:hypothetical protein
VISSKCPVLLLLVKKWAWDLVNSVPTAIRALYDSTKLSLIFYPKWDVQFRNHTKSKEMIQSMMLATSSDEKFNVLSIWEYFFHFNNQLALTWNVKDRISFCKHYLTNVQSIGILTWVTVENFSGVGSLMCLNENALRWNQIAGIVRGGPLCHYINEPNTRK